MQPSSGIGVVPVDDLSPPESPILRPSRLKNRIRSRDSDNALNPRYLHAWLTPSFADCFFLAILVWLFVAGPIRLESLLMDGDTGWHIRTGEFILEPGPGAAHGFVSRTSSRMLRGIAWEWGSDVCLGCTFPVGGLKGIVLFAGVLISAISLVVLRYSVWRGANSLVALLATFMVAGAFLNALSGSAPSIYAPPVAGIRSG